MARMPRHHAGLNAGSIGPETASSLRKPRAFVMLHRVPPDMRIFTPARRFFSSTTTRRSQLGGPDAREQARGPRSQHGDVAGGFFF